MSTLPDVRMVGSLFDGISSFTFSDWPGEAFATAEGSDLLLRFGYDSNWIEDIKGLKIGAHWSEEKQMWIVPVRRWTVEKLGGFLKRRAFSFSQSAWDLLKSVAYGAPSTDGGDA